jgi:hypothetical protein
MVLVRILMSKSRFEDEVLIKLFIFLNFVKIVKSPKGTDSYGQVLAFELTRVLGHNG